jgi:hypothetical protein
MTNHLTRTDNMVEAFARIILQRSTVGQIAPVLVYADVIETTTDQAQINRARAAYYRTLNDGFKFVAAYTAHLLPTAAASFEDRLAQRVRSLYQQRTQLP